MVTHATSALTKHTDAVGLIDHDAGIVLVGEVHDVGELAHVTLHREHAVSNNELHAVGLTLLELSLEGCHVVVLVFERVGERQTPALDDRGMVLLVPQDIVLTPGQRGDNTQIHTETGAVNHRILLALIVGQLALQLLVEVKRSVEEGGSGAAGTVFLCGLNGGLLDALVIDQSRIAVGSEHEHLLAVHQHLGVLFA